MSPIRPENRDRYPTDWPAISLAVKEDAGWRCECIGECGRGTHDGRCPNRHDTPAYRTGSIVILTTAHLNHTPEDCRRENLRAMCQGCHLFYDREHHAQTRAETRRRELEAAGQGDLLEALGALGVDPVAVEHLPQVLLGARGEVEVEVEVDPSAVFRRRDADDVAGPSADGDLPAGEVVDGAQGEYLAVGRADAGRDPHGVILPESASRGSARAHVLTADDTHYLL